MLNQVNLIGRLGQKPELATTQGGVTLAKFSLATTESWTDRNSGQRQERTEWHRLVLFGRLAEIAVQYLEKGDLAYFSGKLQTQEWEKDGIKRYTTEVVVSDMKMLGQSQRQGQQPQGARPQQRTAHQAPTQHQARQAQAPQPSQNFDGFDDDIPF